MSAPPGNPNRPDRAGDALVSPPCSPGVIELTVGKLSVLPCFGRVLAGWLAPETPIPAREPKPECLRSLKAGRGKREFESESAPTKERCGPQRVIGSVLQSTKRGILHVIGTETIDSGDAVFASRRRRAIWEPDIGHLPHHPKQNRPIDRARQLLGNLP